MAPDSALPTKSRTGLQDFAKKRWDRANVTKKSSTETSRKSLDACDVSYWVLRLTRPWPVGQQSFGQRFSSLALRHLTMVDAVDFWFLRNWKWSCFGGGWATSNCSSHCELFIQLLKIKCHKLFDNFGVALVERSLPVAAASPRWPFETATCYCMSSVKLNGKYCNTSINKYMLYIHI